jgi:hypothetical protein
MSCSTPTFVRKGMGVSVVGKTTALQAPRPRNRGSISRSSNRLFSSSEQPDRSEFRQPSVQREQGGIPLGVVQPECKANYTPSSRVGTGKGKFFSLQAP